MHAPISKRTNKTNTTTMKDQQPIVAAIDIGTTKIVCLVGRKNEDGKIDILALSKAPSTGVKRGVVLNIEETVNAMRKTVEEVKQKSGVIFDEVYVGIAGQHIRTIQSRGYVNRESDEYEITRKDIEHLIRDMGQIPVDVGEEIIHVLPQNFIVDNETGVKNPIGMSGRRLEANFHIVIGKVASARNIERCVNRVGMNVKDLILEPLASSTAVLTNDEMEAGVALVDIGGGTTDIAVYYDNVIRHTAVIPFGGNVVTRDIKEGCKILLKQAELLKTTYGSAVGDIAPDDQVVTIPGIAGRDPKEVSFKFLAHIIQARMEEILDEVVYQIEGSGVFDKLAAGIVLTGGGSLLKDLIHLVRYRTGLDVRIGRPNHRLVGDLAEEINQPMYSTAVGLILEGFKQEKEHKKPFVQKTSGPEIQENSKKGNKKASSGDEPQEPDDKNNIIHRIKDKLEGLFEEWGADMDEEEK